MEKTTGQIIYENRRKKRLTQAALAEKLNVTDKAVSKWERDVSRPDINLIPKISEVLEIPAEDLLNIPLKPRQTERRKTAKGGKYASAKHITHDDTEDWEYGFHRSVVSNLLKQGVIGFVAGILLYFVMSLSDSDPFHIGFALSMGFFLSGVPYGWTLLQKNIGSWFLVGSLPIMIISFMLKFAGAFLIGWFTYPIALLYHLFMSQRKGSTARKVYFIILAVVAAFLALILILATSPRKNAKSETEMKQPAAQTITVDNQAVQSDDIAIPVDSFISEIDASYFHPTKVAYCDVVEDAFGRVLAAEEEEISSGYEILEPSSLQACYFMTVKEPGTTHYDFGDGVTFTNAVCVVTHYKVKFAAELERDYWLVYMYPDFTLDENGLLIYSKEKIHEDSVVAADRNEVYAWLCEEYEDMTITELVIPV